MRKISVKNLFFLILTVLVVGAVLFFVARLPFETNETITPLSDHWDVYRETDGGMEALSTNTALSDAHFGVVKTNEVFVLQHLLPEEEVRDASVEIRTVHATLEVYVGDDLVYEDGQQFVKAQSMTPSGFHYAPLPKGYAGKEVRVRLWANEDGAFSGIDPIRVGNTQDLRRSYLYMNRLTLLAGLFLIVMGLVLLFVFLYLCIRKNVESRILFSALISSFLGLYMLSYNDVTDYISADRVLIDMWEYISLFFLPFAFIAFLSSIQEDESLKKPYRAMALFSLVVACATVVLHVFHIVHINRCVTFIHSMIVIEGVTVIVLAIKNAIRARRLHQVESWQYSQKVLMAGFFIMMVFAIVDIARYSFMRYLSVRGDAYANLNFLTVGALIFVISLILNFFYYHIEQVYANETFNRLSGLAYTDPLTDLANRGRCEEMMRTLDEAQTPCTVMSFDVDHLKEINDKYGHTTGDKYLVDMAQALKDVFPDALLLGRMGGDEFIAILEGTSKTEAGAHLDALDNAVASLNKKSNLIRYGISYGFSDSEGGYEGYVKKTFAEADKRMYEMKRDRHRKEAAHA